MRKIFYIAIFIVYPIVILGQNPFPVIKKDSVFNFNRVILNDTHDLQLILDTNHFSIDKEKQLITKDDSVKFVGFVMKIDFFKNIDVFKNPNYNMFNDSSLRKMEYSLNDNLIKYIELSQDSFQENYFIKYIKKLDSEFCFIISIKGLNEKPLKNETILILEDALKNKFYYNKKLAFYNREKKDSKD